MQKLGPESLSVVLFCDHSAGRNGRNSTKDVKKLVLSVDGFPTPTNFVVDELHFQPFDVSVNRFNSPDSSLTFLAPNNRPIYEA
jgi:hypothetical protein